MIGQYLSNIKKCYNIHFTKNFETKQGRIHLAAHLGRVWFLLLNFNFRHIECLDTYMKY
jgi:hypothetical protein